MACIFVYICLKYELTHMQQAYIYLKGLSKGRSWSIFSTAEYDATVVARDDVGVFTDMLSGITFASVFTVG